MASTNDSSSSWKGWGGWIAAAFVCVAFVYHNGNSRKPVVTPVSVLQPYLDNLKSQQFVQPQPSTHEKVTWEYWQGLLKVTKNLNALEKDPRFKMFTDKNNEPKNARKDFESVP